MLITTKTTAPNLNIMEVTFPNTVKDTTQETTATVSDSSASVAEETIEEAIEEAIKDQINVEVNEPDQPVLKSILKQRPVTEYVPTEQNHPHSAYKLPFVKLPKEKRTCSHEKKFCFNDDAKVRLFVRYMYGEEMKETSIIGDASYDFFITLNPSDEHYTLMRDKMTKFQWRLHLAKCKLIQWRAFQSYKFYNDLLCRFGYLVPDCMKPVTEKVPVYLTDEDTYASSVSSDSDSEVEIIDFASRQLPSRYPTNTSLLKRLKDQEAQEKAEQRERDRIQRDLRYKDQQRRLVEDLKRSAGRFGMPVLYSHTRENIYPYFQKTRD
ncbi:hypothetical protein WICPIJ_001908 [Wickerhamomyces pijperi]|uniref:Uncharacterized protein n=1 Tax=Wickerhamomyces pijperi TaxID=599730 RepID=A0A9P8TQ51_WICPI|nr:hypothetical protein WICPIJ_001908 [Wickerhamomyces pijperi]